MPAEGFRTEWFTVGAHRVLLECRVGFPGKPERFVASVAAKTLTHNSNKARLVRVFFDDKSSLYHIEAASTDPEDTAAGKVVEEVLQAIFNNGNYTCEVDIVPRGNEASDLYDHMEHLSVSAGVAFDRNATFDRTTRDAAFD